jgi:uncharacterized protein DUF1018
MTAHRKKIVVMMALWSQVHPCDDAADCRAERLRFLAQQTGRVIDSANDLADDELERAIQLLHKVRLSRGIAPSSKARSGSNVRRFPNRNSISREAVWKIRQLEAYLGWSGVPARLEGFLAHIYKVRRPDDLTHAAAWKCIESLFDVAARAEIKAEKGATYRVPRGELAARAAALKSRLATWQPSTQEAV